MRRVCVRVVRRSQLGLIPRGRTGGHVILDRRPAALGRSGRGRCGQVRPSVLCLPALAKASVKSSMAWRMLGTFKRSAFRDTQPESLARCDASHHRFVRNGVVGLHTHAPVRTDAPASVPFAPALSGVDAAKLLDERIGIVVEQLLPQSADARQVRAGWACLGHLQLMCHAAASTTGIVHPDTCLHQLAA
jgi:hypothetical protein